MKPVSTQDRLLGYVLLAAQLLLLLGLVSLALDGNPSSFARVLSFVVIGAGILVTVYSAMSMGRSLWPTPLPRASGKLVTDGPFKIVRHPMYAGMIIFGIGAAIMSAQVVSIYTLTTLTLVLVWKMAIEERLVSEQYPEFETYRNSTPALIPRVSSFRKAP